MVENALKILCSVRSDRISACFMWWRRRLVWGCMIWLLACTALNAQDLPRFREHVITQELKYGYQLVAADLTKDSRKDLIAVDERATELVWFENRHPVWQRHVLARNAPRQLNADCWDLDADGVPEVVLAYRFESDPKGASATSCS